jgi:hypothetical protein
MGLACAHSGIWPKRDKEIDMNNYRKGFYAAAFSATLAGGLGAAFAASADTAGQPANLETQVEAAAAAAPAGRSLQGVVVNGNGNAFLRSDQRLALLNASLPLDDGNSTVERSDLQRVVALFPRSANASAGEARRMMERGHTLPSGPDADGDLALGAQ